MSPVPNIEICEKENNTCVFKKYVGLSSTFYTIFYVLKKVECSDETFPDAKKCRLLLAITLVHTFGTTFRVTINTHGDLV